MIFKRAQELLDSNISFVTVTLIEVRGSAPQDLGAKALISLKALEAGTVGGGKVEATCINRALEILNQSSQQAPQTVTWNLQKDIKMTCGGEVTFLFEHFALSAWKIALFGAGHVSQALTRSLLNLKCQLTVIDDRREWLDQLPQSSKLQKLCLPQPEQAVAQFDSDTFFISVTKGHSSDVPVLHELAKLYPNAPYIGAIGSLSKANALKAELTRLDVNENFLKKLRVPIGLKLGNNDPEEIAISIVAELLQVRDSWLKSRS